MKLFGWGGNKKPQPQVLQQAKKSDPRTISHGTDRTSGLDPIWGTVGVRWGHKGSNTVKCFESGPLRPVSKQQAQFAADDDGFLHVTKHKKRNDSRDAESDEKLQDTIRFVFSHEREGLLAIGTFALEQLASLQNTFDGQQRAAVQENLGFDSCGGSSLSSHDLQSSDDEDRMQRTWLAARKTCELPVFGDHKETFWDSETDQEPSTERRVQSDQFKATTLYKSFGKRSAAAGIKPIVLLTALPPELRKQLDPASALLYSKSQVPTFVPHWLDAVPPPALTKSEGPFINEEYYSSRLCGLLRSKRKTPKIDKSKIILGRDLSPSDPEQEVKKSGCSVLSLGKLAKLWRSTYKTSSARIAPERRPSSLPGFPVQKGPPCTENGNDGGGAPSLAGPYPFGIHSMPPGRPPGDPCNISAVKLKEQVQMKNATMDRDDTGSTRDEYGKWIKTDSEFLVLEM